MKKISIIIVSYNEKKYLSNAVESCLNQKGIENFEIIIGDDGSTDGSIEEIKNYVFKFPDIISYFVMERTNVSASNIIPSLRVSNVLKKAFSIATGEYIMIMSGDDVNLENKRLYIQSSFLDQNSNYGSCYCNYKMFWDSGREKVILSRASLNPRLFWSGEYIHISCFLFRRNCLNNLLERFCDDTGLIFSILKTGKSKNIKYLGFGYRQREESIMHKADNLELYLLELLLFQDCLNKGGYKTSSISRFSTPLKYVFKHRNEVDDSKYSKYIEVSGQYQNDLVGMLKNYDDLSRCKKIQVFRLIFNSKIYQIIFKILRKANKCVSYLFRI